MSAAEADVRVLVRRHDSSTRQTVSVRDLVFGASARGRKTAMLSTLHGEAARLPLSSLVPYVRINSVLAARVTVLPRSAAQVLPEAAQDAAQRIGEELDLDALDVDLCGRLIMRVVSAHLEAARRPVRHGVAPMRAAEPGADDIDIDQLGPGRPPRARNLRPATPAEEADAARLGEVARRALGASA